MLRFLVVTAVTICSALQIFNYGVVMTEQPLKDDELFEVRLDSKVSKWFGTLDIGATTVPPEGLDFPSSMDGFQRGITFALCGNKILNNGEEITEISKDLNDLTVCYLNQPPKTGNFAVFCFLIIFLKNFVYHFGNSFHY